MINTMIPVAVIDSGIGAEDVTANYKQIIGVQG